jgi:hypothetical protein
MTTPLNTWISVKDAIKPDYDYDRTKYTLLVSFLYSNNQSFESAMMNYTLSDFPNATHWILLSKPTEK